MYETHHEAGEDFIVHTTLKVADAEKVCVCGQRLSLTVSIGDVDLPAFVSDGVLYVQAPLPHLFEAFAEDISDFVRDLEIRVSTAGGTPFSLDSDGRPVSGTAMAQSRVVRGRGKR